MKKLLTAAQLKEAEALLEGKTPEPKEADKSKDKDKPKSGKK